MTTAGATEPTWLTYREKDGAERSVALVWFDGNINKRWPSAGFPTMHLLSGRAQTRTLCGAVKIGDPGLVYASTLTNLFAVPCAKCFGSAPASRISIFRRLENAGHGKF